LPTDFGEAQLFHPLQHGGFDPAAPKLDVAGSIPAHVP
jgi:hypothetical protein